MTVISRRALMSRGALAAAVVAGAALGFTRTVHHKVAEPPPPAPVELTGALRIQDELLADYQALAAAGGPQTALLTALRSDVAAQRDAVVAILQLYPGWRFQQAASASSPSTSAQPSTSGQPSSSGVAAGSVAELKSAIGAATRYFSKAALEWPGASANADKVVPLFGSIAAGLTTQGLVLR
jgi:hypothetical protein